MRVFASLFAKRERVSGQRPENSKRKKDICTLSTDERLKKGNKKVFVPDAAQSLSTADKKVGAACWQMLRLIVQ